MIFGGRLAGKTESMLRRLTQHISDCVSKEIPVEIILVASRPDAIFSRLVFKLQTEFNLGVERASSFPEWFSLTKNQEKVSPAIKIKPIIPQDYFSKYYFSGVGHTKDLRFFFYDHSAIERCLPEMLQQWIQDLTSAGFKIVPPERLDTTVAQLEFANLLRGDVNPERWRKEYECDWNFRKWPDKEDENNEEQNSGKHKNDQDRPQLPVKKGEV